LQVYFLTKQQRKQMQQSGRHDSETLDLKRAPDRVGLYSTMNITEEPP
jgi:hypothetical protein